ncbi:MAG: phosphoribosyl-AMP cyclohydrolase [Chloroflexota bacterium]|nr:MAG: phosphoribosyl-AMP cyclohydrolase [Chloroflexota bacterium]
MSFRPAKQGEIPPEIQFNEAGLIPVIVQDATSQQVLMLAWMNEASLRLTLEQGETWFWSRSRGELWHKGATSGNTQKVREICYDCDGDTLLVKVDAAGPACHTGEVSCFFRKIGTDQ